VAPGIIRTGFHQDPDRPEKLASTIPLGRPGEPEEIAAAVALLASPLSNYTTGALWRIDGGISKAL
jgi:NAD(P)-dependent dehydrogenase (short-subunit alcohol dehydrogenase family)